MTFMTFHHIGNLIIPTDELIFFRGVGIPPTIYICIYMYIPYGKVPDVYNSKYVAQKIVAYFGWFFPPDGKPSGPDPSPNVIFVFSQGL